MPGFSPGFINEFLTFMHCLLFKVHSRLDINFALLCCRIRCGAHVSLYTPLLTSSRALHCSFLPTLLFKPPSAPHYRYGAARFFRLSPALVLLLSRLPRRSARLLYITTGLAFCQLSFFRRRPPFSADGNPASGLHFRVRTAGAPWRLINIPSGTRFINPFFIRLTVTAAVYSR
jgi:hypothetical protein